MSEMMQGFGRFLEALRGNMTLREAASKSGLSHAYIRDLEREINRSSINAPINPSPDTLMKLSIAYNYSYVDLMIKAGHLAEGSTLETESESDKAIDIDSLCYVKVEEDEVSLYANGKIQNKRFSLSDFSAFMEQLEQKEFKRVDAQVFVNLRSIKGYDEKEGKLYFNEDHSGEFVFVAKVRQHKFHQQFLRAVSVNTGSPIPSDGKNVISRGFFQLNKGL